MRNLTEEDIDALASKILEKAQVNFYKGVGQGVWGLIKKALLPALLILAMYGMSNSRDLLDAIVQNQGAK